MAAKSPNYCLVDDKHVPLYRVIWISDTPHFCGEEDCMHEGEYEIRLEQGECVWATRAERDLAIEALDEWMSGPEPPDEM
ncbi:MAG: hypothetical protein KDA63_07235 [Planctomycetales bacterium]|nr:hypothetical protein [Planctomycetales bacterium]